MGQDNEAERFRPRWLAAGRSLLPGSQDCRILGLDLATSKRTQESEQRLGFEGGVDALSIVWSDNAY